MQLHEPCDGTSWKQGSTCLPWPPCQHQHTYTASVASKQALPPHRVHITALRCMSADIQYYSATDHRLGAEAIPDPWQDKSNCSAAVHDCLYCALAQNPWQNTTICDDWRVNHHRRLRTATSASLAAVDRRACCKLCEPLPPHRVASNVACRVLTAQPSFQVRRVGSA